MTLHANSSTQEQDMTEDNTGVSFSVDVTINAGDDLTIKATMVHKGNNVWTQSFLKADNFKLYRLPEDVTSTYITNADLKDVSADASTDAAYWPVYTTGRTSGKQKHPKNWYLHTNGTKDHNVGGDFFECWAASNGVKRWTLFQDVTLPAGSYRLTGQYSTNESRGIIKTVAITPHHSYFSTGIKSSNWGSWGSEIAEFTIYESTKVRVGMIATNFAQNHGFTLTTTTAHQFLADEIAAAPAALTSAIATAQGVFDNASAGDDAYRTAAKNLHDAVVAYKLTNATAESPVDMTDKIANPSFEGVGGSTTYTGANHACSDEWTYCSSTDKGSYSATNANHLITNDSNDGFYYMNLWGGVSDFFTKQTLTSLPAGRYKLTALYASDSGNIATLYMNSTGDGDAVSASGSGNSTFVQGTTIYDMQADGDVEIGMSSNKWFKVDGFKLEYLGTLLTAAQADWQTAYDAAVAARDNASYTNVKGDEKDDLLDAISTYGSKPATIEACETATDALNDATSTFIAAKASYDAYFAEKTIATDKVGVAVGDITDPTLASNCADAINTLKVQEFNYVKDTYTVDATTKFGEWSPQNTSTASGQHWSGDGRSYVDKWDGNGFTMSITSTVTLPAGKYAFKAAARAALNGVFSLTMFVGDEYVDYTVKGDSGYGIDTSGNANFSGSGSYANNNNGRGWEWRHLTFDLDESTSVTLKIQAVVKGGNWASFSDYQLLTTSDNVAILKDLLNTEIATATAIDKTTNVGTGIFQTPSSAVTTLNDEIDDAQEIYDNSSATSSEVSTAISNLQTAEATYKATINAPAVGKKYYIKVATPEHAKLNNAWLLAAGATSTNNPTGYTIQANNAPADYLCQAYTFTQVSGNTYKISISRPEGEVYLTNGTKNGSAAGHKAGQIQATTVAENAMVFKIEAGNVANTFYIYNTETHSTIACQSGGNIYTESGNAYFSVAEASPVSISVNLAAGKYGTRIFPFVPSLPSEVKAYSCKAVDGSTLTLEEVTTPEANVPYIIYSEDGYTGAALTGYGTAAATSYTTGYLTGIYNTPTIEANANHYVLQTKDNGEQAFCIVTEDFTNTAPYRAYLTYEAPAGVKVLNFSFDDTPTAVNGIDVTQNEKATIYNLAGQRLNKAQKGVNIINGKKVLIK